MRNNKGQFVKGHRASPKTEFKSGKQHRYFGKKRPEHSKRMSGKNHPLYGKHHSKKSIKKMSETRKGFIGNKNPSWKGGRLVKSQAYILVYAPDHPHKTKGKYVYEHRLVMEKKIGRYLTSSEEVHHINGNKHDNRIDNLMLFANKSAHKSLHPIIKKSKKLYNLTILPTI